MNEREKETIREDLNGVIVANELFNISLKTIFNRLHTAYDFLNNKMKIYENCSDWDAEALRDLSTLGALRAYIDDLSNEWDNLKGRQDDVINKLLYILEQPYKVPEDLMKELLEKI